MTRYAILAVFLFTSCSANFHLKQAQRHLKIAEQKGAKITADTVYKEIKVPETKIDTFVNEVTLEKLLRDTITVTQNNEVIKIKYVPKEKRIYVKSERKKPIYIKVPVVVNKTIKAGHSNWDMIILAIFCVCVGGCVGWVVKSARR
jgi:hypothetical protein